MIRKHPILLAPAAAPVAPASGGGSAAPAAPSPAPAPADSSGDDFGGVDALTKPKPAAAPAKPAAQPKPGEPAKPDANEPAWDETDYDKKLATPKALRDAHKRAVAKAKEFEGKVRETERRIADAERRGQDTTVLTKRLAEMEKEKNDLQASLRAAKQEVSPEFKQKYDAPIDNAVKEARQLVGELNVVDADGNPISKGEWSHFTRIYGMGYADAKSEAKRLFGEESGVIMDAWREIHKLNNARGDALKGEQENWQKLQEQEKANEVAAKESWKTAIENASKEIAEKHAEWFQDGQDSDENNIRKKASDVLDNWIAGKDKDGNPLTPQAMARASAMIRHRAANHAVMVYRFNKAQERIAELEGKLKELNGGDPGDTRRPGGEGSSGGESEPAGIKGLSADLRKALAG